MVILEWLFGIAIADSTHQQDGFAQLGQRRFDGFRQGQVPGRWGQAAVRDGLLGGVDQFRNVA